MIFVVLGTQKFQCNRLLKKLDDLVGEGKINEEVFAQKGNSDYEPHHISYTKFLQKHEFESKIRECSLLITHSGVGTIISGVSYQKPVIVFPRLKKYKEHVDDHQLDIARAFQKKKLVLMCGEKDDLYEIIQISKIYKFSEYVSQQGRIIDEIRNYLREEVTYV